MKDSESELRLLVNCHKNYLQLLYREIEEILLYQGFPRPILPAKPMAKLIFNFQKKLVLNNFIVFCDASVQIFSQKLCRAGHYFT